MDEKPVGYETQRDDAYTEKMKELRDALQQLLSKVEKHRNLTESLSHTLN